MGFLKRNIIFVDDDPSSGRLLHAMLTQAGYYVSIAADGFQALEMVSKYAFDLLILDIMMPQMNGFDFLKRLRSADATKHLPVIMLTAKDDPKSVKRAKELGANDYIIKPPKKDTLIAKIENLLGGRPRFAEIHLDVDNRDAVSELVLACRVISIGEAGVVIHAPIAIQPDSVQIFRAPIFTKMGLDSPCLKCIENIPDKTGYLNYFSYLGLSDEEVHRIRDWVVQTKLTSQAS